MSIGNTHHPPPSESVPLELFPLPSAKEDENPAGYCPLPALGAFSLSSVLPRLQSALVQLARQGEGMEALPRAGLSLLETLNNNITQLQDHFTDRLYEALKNLGVNTSCKLTLRLDEGAALVLSGDHPEKEAIQALLDDSPEFAAVFAEIATQSAVLRDVRSLYTVALYERTEESYAALAASPGESIYQLSLKGEMNHFYFTR